MRWAMLPSETRPGTPDVPEPSTTNPAPTRSLTSSSPSVTERADSIRYSASVSTPMIRRARSNVSCAAVCCSSRYSSSPRNGLGGQGTGVMAATTSGESVDRAIMAPRWLAASPRSPGARPMRMVVIPQADTSACSTTTWVTARFGYVSRARSTTS